MRSFKVWVLTGLVALFHSAPVHADLVARFDEGAPKDRFTVLNTGTCSLANAVVTLDLSGSKAGLIFDTTGNGAGVEVFQPLEIVDGATALSEPPSVGDGDNRVELRIALLAPNKAIAFTVDVDDTAGGREITVSDSEIKGAALQLSQGSQVSSALFETGPEAMLPLPDC